MQNRASIQPNLVTLPDIRQERWCADQSVRNTTPCGGCFWQLVIELACLITLGLWFRHVLWKVSQLQKSL